MPHLSLLAVDGGNVDDAAELAFAHALDHRAAHVEQRNQIGVDHSQPLLGSHAMEHAVAGDAGVVDEHLDRTEIGRNLLQSRDAGVIG